MTVAVLIILGGVWITIVGRHDLALAWQSRHWPHVRGRITAKHILEGLCAGISTDGTKAPTVLKWKELELEYSYEVSDIIYSSRRFDFSGYGLRLNTHYYEDDEEVVVYYLPQDPSVSVLHPGLRSNLVFGPLVIVAGICALFIIH